MECTFMNDFTKEELKCLHNAIVLQLRDIPMSETNAIKRSELVGKIQSMIESYTELKPPTMANYCCDKCNEEWHRCECKDE